jgi:4,5-DOPA dioxygenase extradiol
MNRAEFLKRLGLAGLGIVGLDALLQAANGLPILDERMPALFIGHGSPTNILADNSFTRSWAGLGESLPRPKLIVVISAHWLTRGSYVTASPNPSIIYDFFGYPDALYHVKYPVAGSLSGAKALADHLAKAHCAADNGRGIDHGAWMILRHLYPDADIPVVQLSIDRSKGPEYARSLGVLMNPLRSKGVLFIGSGNIVHNLGQASPEEDAIVPDWAEEFDTRVKNLVERGDGKGLCGYESWGAVSSLAHPSNDHYLPLLYAEGLRSAGESAKFCNEGFQYSTVSMRCIQYG